MAVIVAHVDSGRIVCDDAVMEFLRDQPGVLSELAVHAPTVRPGWPPFGAWRRRQQLRRIGGRLRCFSIAIGASTAGMRQDLSGAARVAEQLKRAEACS